ncbi:tripartite tricarboxylate transporter substrate-binding protein [Frigidibacter oleivorans]|uniref:tripartite tricarboxylate transporter substrate-binding protein n=1 Tax=Frigidibacter oleivorans TaxID=2487129 RepID=UPI000F8E9D1B|nr:tripartite tricarboxylate transporter substrate-binding protein [Frigidibacter oleivorans]
MNRIARTCAMLASLVAAPFAATAQDWTPPGPITLMIGFAAGGGADTQARLVASGVEDKTGWTILPQQVTGNSGLNLAKELSTAPADGTVIGMVVSETLAYNAVIAGDPALQAENFTPLATTAAFQMGLIAVADGRFSTWDKVKAEAEAGTPIRFGVATERQADMAYHFGLETGIPFNIVSVAGGAEIMNGVRAGDLDIGWVAGAQAKAVTAGELVNIATAIPTPLAESPDAPSIVDLGSEFYLDGYFMFIAPKDIPEEARVALAQAIADVASDPNTQAGALIQRSFGGAAVLTGAELDAYIAKGVQDSSQLLEAIK